MWSEWNEGQDWRWTNSAQEKQEENKQVGRWYFLGMQEGREESWEKPGEKGTKAQVDVGATGLVGGEKRQFKAGTCQWKIPTVLLLTKAVTEPWYCSCYFSLSASSCEVYQGNEYPLHLLPVASPNYLPHYMQFLHGQQWSWNRSWTCGNQHGPT